VLLDSHEAAIELSRSNQSAAASGEGVQYEFPLDGARFDDVSHERDGLLDAVDLLRDCVILEHVEGLRLDQPTATVDPKARLVAVDPVPVWIPDAAGLLQPDDRGGLAGAEV